jgi:hypothetical protein
MAGRRQGRCLAIGDAGRMSATLQLPGAGIFLPCSRIGLWTKINDLN